MKPNVPRIHRTALAWAALLGTGVAFASGEGAVLDTDYAYVVIDQDIRDCLRNFAFDRNIPLDLGDDVRGRLGGRLAIANGRELLDQAALAGGAAWYYDGRRLVVRKTSAWQWQRFPARHLSPSERSTLLAILAPLGRDVSLSYDASDNAVVARGPAEFIGRVALALKPPASPRSRAVEVLRFRSM